MKIYKWDVEGASPGFNGVIVVVAMNNLSAKRKALAEIDSMNVDRVLRGWDLVRLGERHPGKPEELPKTGGVVYSYDGEA